MIISYTTGRPSNTVIGSTIDFPEGKLPALAITSFLEVNTLQEMFQLEVQEGDIAYRADTQQTYVSLNNNNGTITDWKEIRTPVVVKSVNSYIGEVVLNKTDIGLSEVSNDPQLKIASNLEDLDNAETSRTNLAVYSKVEIDAQNTTLTAGTSAVTANLNGHASNADVHREISDNDVANTGLWSSSKINSEILGLNNKVNAGSDNVGYLLAKIAFASSF